MSTTSFSEEDEGKNVVDSTGEKVGIVSEVRAGTAYIDPDPGLMDQMKSRLGWGDVDEDTYPLDAGDVTDITDDEIRIRHFE